MSHFRGLKFFIFNYRAFAIADLMLKRIGRATNRAHPEKRVKKEEGWRKKKKKGQKKEKKERKRG